jgi:hypothetical protein
MVEQQISTVTTKKQRLIALFEKLLPLVNSVATKLRWLLILGLLALVWLGVWSSFIQHFAWPVTGAIIGLAVIPWLILLRFWWSLQELQDLPTIALQMLGDAKQEFRASVQNRTAKLSFFGATKGLWSIGSLLSDCTDLLGSYISLATLMNPFMLILGMISLISMLILLPVSGVLALLTVVSLF